MAARTGPDPTATLDPPSGEPAAAPEGLLPPGALAVVSHSLWRGERSHVDDLAKRR